MKKMEFKVSGMHCNSCAALIKMNLSDIDGVSDIDANYERKSVRVSFNDESIEIEELIKKIEADGYKVTQYNKTK